MGKYVLRFIGWVLLLYLVVFKDYSSQYPMLLRKSTSVVSLLHVIGDQILKYYSSLSGHAIIVVIIFVFIVHLSVILFFIFKVWQQVFGVFLIFEDRKEAARKRRRVLGRQN